MLRERSVMNDFPTGRIQTVRGAIDPDALGPTLMHEHIFCDIVPPALAAKDREYDELTLQNLWDIAHSSVDYAPKFRLSEPEVARTEVARVGQAGGAMVELTNTGLKPRPEALRKISEETGVPIVMGSGNYVEEYQDESFATATVDRLAGEIIGQLGQGAWGSEVRSGIIGEIGCQSPWTENEQRAMCAAVVAQQESGAAITVHPGRAPDQPMQVIDLIRREGGDPERTVISHIDRTIFDRDRLHALADTGCVLEFDLFGMEQSYYMLADIDLPNDGARVATIRDLFDRGHRHQVVISHDICFRTRLRHYGGHGYDHIFLRVLPLMLRRGFTQAEVDAIMIETPRRLLTFR
ncbi:MAG: aryldialkylphosphatase [Alphaproteobacteria bacterium]|nr:aryldialkylphosphatase [Alphaproteobacteria bacterium]